MKKAADFALNLYQKILSPLLHQALGVQHACRYFPTCSEYARIHIKGDGFFLGGIKSIMRLLYCQPFARNLPTYLQK